MGSIREILKVQGELRIFVEESLADMEDTELFDPFNSETDILVIVKCKCNLSKATSTPHNQF